MSSNPFSQHQHVGTIIRKIRQAHHQNFDDFKVMHQVSAQD